MNTNILEVATEPSTTMDSTNIVINKDVTSTSLNGFGDIIKLLTSLFGLDTCDKCEERRIKLNRRFSFVRAGKVINANDVAFLKSLTNSLNVLQQEQIVSIYNHTFSTNQEICQCAGLFKAMLEKLTAQIERQEKGKK